MEKGSIWVWVEKADGKVTQTSQEVLSQGRSMADELGGSLLAIMAGPVSEVNLEDLCGLPDQIIALEGDGEGSPSLIVETLEELIRKDPPWALLAPGTPSTMDWMPRLSVRLGVEMVSDVVGMELLEGGRLRVKRPVHGGRFLVEMESQEGGPRLLALRPRAFARKTGSRSPRVECFPMKARGPTEVQVLEKAQREKGFVDLSEARIVVSGGRGMGGPEAFFLLEELAAILGGAVGASRSVVDSGWRPASEQVGKSGRSVSPDLYMAFGISGAIHHIMGMDSSKVVVAVNKDPNALIFQHADLGIVDDVNHVLPALIEELKRRS